jgi:hypothetical protein
MRSRIFALAVLISCFTAAAAFAQCKPISSLPVTINTAGTWCLSSDLTNYYGGAAIVINTSNVTIDLNGFRLTSGGGNGYGISSTGANNNLVIRNGQISAGYRGIMIEPSSGSSYNVEISHLVIDSFTSMAIDANVQQSLIHDVVVQMPVGGSAWGIYTTNADIDHVRVTGSYIYGIYSNGGAFKTVRNSFAEGSTAAVIFNGYGTGSVVNCELNGGFNYGVYIATGAISVIGNRIQSTGNAITYSGSASGKYRDNVFLGTIAVVGGTDAGNNS